MPIYEYHCEKCGHTLEVMQKINDAPLTRCPHCEAEGLRKLVSAAGFRLKGGGWYETDFKKDAQRNLVKDDKPTAEKKTGDSDTSSSTKT